MPEFKGGGRGGGGAVSVCVCVCISILRRGDPLVIRLERYY